MRAKTWAFPQFFGLWEENIFYLCFRRLSEAAENMAFSDRD